MKIIRFSGILIGLALAGYLLHQVGIASVRHSLGLLGWGYLVVLVYPISWILLNTAGWRAALRTEFVRISLIGLARIRVVGETFNSLLPSGYVGGEPLKAKLLSRWIPLREAVSSVLIAKSAQSIGLVLFIGLGLTLGKGASTSPLKQPGTLTAIGLLSIGIGIFTWLLSRRSFSRLGRWLQRFSQNPWLSQQEHRLQALDDSLGAFYRDCKGRFVASTAWHCAGWLAGALEVAVIFSLMGHPITWRQAWFIGAMAQLASTVGLLIPAGVGLYEGGHYLAATLLGLPPSLGLTVSLIRRVREVFWDLIGLSLLWWFTKTNQLTKGQASAGS